MNEQRLFVNDLVRAISQLPKDRRYHYINPSTKTILVIDSIQLPEGPIYVKRWNPSKGEGLDDATITPISTEMMARIANAFVPDHPINFDRVLGASYNTRSALETLLAHTPEFYVCYPGRIDSYTGEVRSGHKHLMWSPNNPHRPGEIVEQDVDLVISEMTFEVRYEGLQIPDTLADQTIDIEVARQHARIQIALILIGQQLGYRTWIAQNDRGIVYNNRVLAEMETVIDSLDKEPLIGLFKEAVRSALLIDCIWFGNSRYMPAVMEIEHSTGVTSGLTRMRGFQEAIPSINTRYVIVAPDDLRKNVIEKANQPQFRQLNARYFPYSAVEELYRLCQRRKIRGVTQEFLDSFMEIVVE